MSFKVRRHLSNNLFSLFTNLYFMIIRMYCKERDKFLKFSFHLRKQDIFKNHFLLYVFMWVLAERLKEAHIYKFPLKFTSMAPDSCYLFLKVFYFRFSFNFVQTLYKLVLFVAPKRVGQFSRIRCHSILGVSMLYIIWERN